MKRLKLTQTIAAAGVAVAMLAAVPGSVPTLPDQAKTPSGYAGGVPQWEGEPSAKRSGSTK